MIEKSAVFSKVFAVFSLGLFLLQGTAFAGDLEWSGIYRVEGNHINKSELDSSGRQKDYGTHTLVLRPKIVPSDGLLINAQFNIFNFPATDPHYGPNQLGQVIGTGVGVATPTTANESDSLSGTMASGELVVTELYLTLAQEFGSLIVGRAPIQFGLGMYHNAGKGMFDHWFDTRDLIGYKMVMGNMFLLPMYGKVNEGSINASDDVIEYLIQLQYENPETDLEMGVFYSVRKASDQGTDTPADQGADGLLGGTGAVRVGNMNWRTINLYALKDTQSYRLGVEASFQDGKSGVRTASGSDVAFNGFGIAGEFEFRPEASKWKFGSKFGYATGDDPETDDTFEGFVFDRNYDVAFMLFNHPLGQADFFRTEVFGGGPTTGSIQTADTEALSNVLYLSPYFKYQWADRYVLHTVFTTGWLNTNPIAGTDVGKELGYEVDFSLDYQVRKGLQWVNTIGLLFPGDAFKAGGTLDADFSYGLTSKAAISF